MAKGKAKWRLGTMGFGYADWKEVFYPKLLKSGDYLEYYSRYFNAVELDTTFHAIPDEERVRKWAEAVPANFRFSAKAPKDVTHQKDPSAHVSALNEFVEVMKTMGE